MVGAGRATGVETCELVLDLMGDDLAATGVVDVALRRERGRVSGSKNADGARKPTFHPSTHLQSKDSISEETCGAKEEARLT